MRLPDVKLRPRPPSKRHPHRPVEAVTVRVWELPVRITHWTIFASFVVLSITGFYIARPWFGAGSGSAFLMGKMRLVHFITAFVFTTAVVSRLLWALIGNQWARWDQFVPVSRERRRLIQEVLAYYLFRRRQIPATVGHNPLAGLTYSVLYLMFGVQIVTGFALFSLPANGGITHALTGWVFKLAPIGMVRLIHYMIMWLTFGFIVHHVYAAVLSDIEEPAGMISSIFTGYKRVPRELL